MKPSPYLPGPQQTKFLSCRSPPWGRCGLFGDPHIHTFDTNAIDRCPTIPGKRNTEVLQAVATGVHSLIQMPPSAGSDLLVTGRFGAVSAPTVAILKGLAVQGSFIGSGELVVEIQGKNDPGGMGAVQPTWKDASGIRHEILKRDVANKTNTSWTDEHLHATLQWTSLNLVDVHHGSSSSSSSTLRPVWTFHFKTESGEVFLRVYMTWQSDTLFDATISMQKDHSHDQEGLCGNFDCIPGDDGKNATQQESYKISDGGLFQFIDASTGRGPVSPPAATELSGLVEGCVAAGVAPGLSEMCAHDISRLGSESDKKKDDIDDIFNSYKFFGSNRAVTPSKRGAGCGHPNGHR